MKLKASEKAVDDIEVTAKGRILCFWPNALVLSQHLLAGIAYKKDRKHIQQKAGLLFVLFWGVGREGSGCCFSEL